MMMNNGYFTQGGPFTPQGGFAQQAGLTFNNVAPAKSTSSTQEELDIIKSKGGTNFEFNVTDTAIAGWDFREGTNLCIELIDAATDLVRAKYTGEEFNIVLVEDALVKEILNSLRNVVNTTKLLNTSLDKDISKQIYIAFGILEKLLPTAYANGRKNYNNVIQQARQQVGVMGYQGNFGQNPMMFNGQFGTAPNYFVNDSSVGPNIPNMGYGYQPDMNAIVAAVAQQMQMGAPTQPNGGTLMGGNPFVQGGQTQQTPQMMGNPTIPSVPFPGAPTNTPQVTPPIGAPQVNPPIGTPQVNPPIGAPAQPATTTSAPF